MLTWYKRSVSRDDAARGSGAREAYGSLTCLSHTPRRARAEAPRGRLRGRPRLPLRVHTRLVAALEGPLRGGLRPGRHAVPGTAGRVAVVADLPEPRLPRG